MSTSHEENIIKNGIPNQYPPESLKIYNGKGGSGSCSHEELREKQNPPESGGEIYQLYKILQQDKYWNPWKPNKDTFDEIVGEIVKWHTTEVTAALTEFSRKIEDVYCSAPFDDFKVTLDKLLTNTIGRK